MENIRSMTNITSATNEKGKTKLSTALKGNKINKKDKGLKETKNTQQLKKQIYTKENTGTVHHVGNVAPSKQILRTIILPNEKVIEFQQDVERLKQLNQDQNDLYEKEINGLKEDRRRREEKMRVKYIDLEEKNNLLIDKANKLEKLNTEITKGKLIRFS